MAARQSIRSLIACANANAFASSSSRSAALHTSPVGLIAPSRRTHDAAPAASSSSSSTSSAASTSGPGSGSSAFARLGSISSSTSLTPSSSSSPFLPFVPDQADVLLSSSGTAGRGYQPKHLAPKVDPMLGLFTNLLMKHGRKAEAETRTQLILDHIQRAANSPPLPLLTQAIGLCSPSVRLQSTRKRAKRVECPQPMNERQRARQGIMWLFKAAERGRKAGTPRDQRIAREVFAVLEGTSDVFKWLEDRHKAAALNRSNVVSNRL